MGVALAEPDRRVILLTGDGAHQETMGAIATMGFHGVKPIVFVLNNGAYGCEYDLDQGRYHYNEIAPIRYSQLPEVFGCPNWLHKGCGLSARSRCHASSLALRAGNWDHRVGPSAGAHSQPDACSGQPSR